MMNAILMAVVGLFETVVNYSLGAIVIALAVLGTLAACRWLLAERGETGRAVTMLRKGSGSLPLAAVLIVALGCILAGVALLSR